jgi:signal transduction histidine kinase
MIPKIIKKIRSSIFLKILIVIACAGVLINLAVIRFYRLHVAPSTWSEGRTHLEKYAHYIIKDIGNPPDKERALQVAGELNLRIQYKGPSGSWSTHPDFPGNYKSQYSGSRNIRHYWWYRGRFYLEIPEGNGAFLFSNNDSFIEPHKEFVIYLIIMASLILAGAYLLLRRILKPVKWLRQGVNQVALGNFDTPIPVRKDDELGELSKSFNAMSSRIKEMIKSREQLLLDVSHELRSPLTRIKVSLEFLNKDERYTSISEDIHEIETMITEILESERINSRHGRLEKRNTDIISLIKNLVQEYKDSSPGIILNLHPDKIAFEADEERLRIAFKNIVDNAVKYSTETSSPIKISVQQEDKHIHIDFKDSGTGIGREHLPYIFEPFYRADSSRSKRTGGYGLGMSLCKKIIESHGGTISIESEPGKGTTVFVTLPAADNSRDKLTV